MSVFVLITYVDGTRESRLTASGCFQSSQQSKLPRIFYFSFVKNKLSFLDWSERYHRKLTSLNALRTISGERRNGMIGILRSHWAPFSWNSVSEEVFIIKNWFNHIHRQVQQQEKIQGSNCFSSHEYVSHTNEWAKFLRKRKVAFLSNCYTSCVRCQHFPSQPSLNWT